jgi:hypothetical protein
MDSFVRTTVAVVKRTRLLGRGNLNPDRNKSNAEAEWERKLDMVDESSFAIDMVESEVAVRCIGGEYRSSVHDGMVTGPMVIDHHRSWDSENIVKTDLS